MKNFEKLLKGASQKETIDKENKQCIYCNKNVYTTNKGICSRKSCKRLRGISYDKHGQYIKTQI